MFQNKGPQIVMIRGQYSLELSTVITTMKNNPRSEMTEEIRAETLKDCDFSCDPDPAVAGITTRHFKTSSN